MTPGEHRAAYGLAYRRKRALILAGNPPCHWCGAPATTADHEPPIEVVGHPHLNLVPACAPCNFGRRGRAMVAADPGPSRSW